MARHGLLDGRIAFVEGFFADTLAQPAPMPLAVLGVNGDLYSSTMEMLETIYPRPSPGGIAILHDQAWSWIASAPSAHSGAGRA